MHNSSKLGKCEVRNTSQAHFQTRCSADIRAHNYHIAFNNENMQQKNYIKFVPNKQAESFIKIDSL